MADPENTKAHGEPQEPSIPELLSREFGADVDPGISLDEDSSSPDEQTPVGLAALRARQQSSSRYSIRGEVGRGGMGIILRVWDQDLRRSLAMKILLAKDKAGAATPTTGSGPRALGRFLEEAQITGQLNHPGVVPVHELGVDVDGRVFFTMRLIKGRSFGEIIRLARTDREGWNRLRALEVILKVCDTMAYAHSKGVIHRDLKPANVMVGRFGETYVMDWGLAKVLGQAGPSAADLDTLDGQSFIRTDREPVDSASSEELVTMDGTVLGTPSYMPPEQGEGRIEELDRRADVYAVGAMLYHLTAGCAPYTRPGTRMAPQAILSQLFAGPPPRIHELDKDVPAELVAICEKAMARDPADRYADTQEMAADVRAFVERRVVRAYRTGPYAEFRKWVGRNRATAGLLAAILLILLGGSFGFSWVQVQQRHQIEAQRRRTQEEKERAEQSEVRARRQSYVANLAAADASLRTGEVREARRRLENCDPTWRSFEWNHLRSLSEMSAATFHGHEEPVEAVSVSADGRVAVSASAQKVLLWDLAARPGAEPRVLTGHEAAVTSVAMSAAGDRIVAGMADGTLRKWMPAFGSEASPVTNGWTAIQAVALSPDGEQVASVEYDGTLRLWDFMSGEARGRLAAASARPVLCVTFSRDGEWVATGSEDGIVRMFEPGTDRVVFERSQGAAAVTGVALSADRRRLATSSHDGAVRIFDLEGGDAPLLAGGHDGAAYCVAFDPAHEVVVSGGQDRLLRLYDATSGQLLDDLRGHEDAVRCVGWSSAGIVSGSTDGSVRSWDPSARRAFRTFQTEGDEVVAALSPDGGQVVEGSRSRGRLRVRNTRTGEVQGGATIGDDRVTCVAFRPDGGEFAVGLEVEATILLFDPQTGVQTGEILGHDSTVRSLAYSPDGASIVSGGADAQVLIWPAHSADEPLISFDLGLPVYAVAFHPDGARVAVAREDGVIELRAVGGAAGTTTLQGHSASVHALAFDPSGRWLASGSSDHVVILWDLEDGSTRAELVGHAGRINGLVFGMGGERLASGSSDGTVRLWDVTEGDPQLLLTLRQPPAAVTTVDWSRDGRTILAGTAGGLLCLWEAPSQSHP